MSKYLVFTDLPAKRPDARTRVVEITSKRGGERLGLIGWYGPWRQYTLRSEDTTVWSSDCLEAICDVLATMNDDHRRIRAAERADRFGRARG